MVDLQTQVFLYLDCFIEDGEHPSDKVMLKSIMSSFHMDDEEKAKTFISKWKEYRKSVQSDM